MFEQRPPERLEHDDNDIFSVESPPTRVCILLQGQIEREEGASHKQVRPGEVGCQKSGRPGHECLRPFPRSAKQGKRAYR